MKIAIALVLLALLAGLVLPSATLKTSSNGEHRNDANSHDKDDGQANDKDDGQSHNKETGQEESEVEFDIQLTGAQQVRPVTTRAFGEANVELTDNGMRLKFELEVCNITDVTAAHIHVGSSGMNGPVVLFLYGPNAPVFTAKDGCKDLSSGTLTPADLKAKPEAGVSTWDDFVKALMAGKTYVNVHTTANPDGEIRGQLTPEAEGED